MGKIKSAIITALLVAAIAVLAFFALFSWPVAGSNTDRYNSFISSIHLGSDLSGEATTVLYPDGVISAAEYKLGIPEAPDEGDKDYDKKYEEYQDKLTKYTERFEQVGGYYIDIDVLEENGGKDGLKEKVANDAKVLSNRFEGKGYFGYSVSVQDEYTIKVAVPTNFSYSEYQKNNRDTASRQNEITTINRSFQYLAYNGELSLRSTEDLGWHTYDSNLNNYFVTPNKDIKSYFTGASMYAIGGNYAVKVDLTEEGKEQFKKISTKITEGVEQGTVSDDAIGFYVGDYKLLSLTVSDVIESGSFYITVDEVNAQDYSIILDSVVRGEEIALNYNSDELEIVCTTATLGDTAALFLGVTMLLIVVAAIAYSVARYRLLGLVNSIIIIMYALTIITALLVIGIQLTVAGAIMAALGLVLLCGSNFAVFEDIRNETKKGKTMQSAVKSGYKNLLKGILEMHIVLLVAAILFALVGVGELAACGLIFLIGTVASYVLYWFTRFMWYVISSPAKNKFAFCGFKREEHIDE